MAVDAVDVVVNINKSDIKLHMGGGFWTDLASIFEVFFKGTVVDDIVNGLKTALSTTLPKVTNQALIDNNGMGNIIPYLWWDWESPTAAIVTSNTFEFATKGLLFDNRTGEVDPGVVPPELPYRHDNPAELQGFVSTYAIDSFFQTGLSIYDAAHWFNSSLVDPNGFYPTNTSTIDLFIGGAADYYGPSQPANIHLDFTNISNVTVSEEKKSMGAKFTLAVEIWVVKNDTTEELAASFTLVDTAFEFTALADNMTLGVQLVNVNVDKITTGVCTFGKMHPNMMKTAINVGF